MENQSTQPTAPLSSRLLLVKEQNELLQELHRLVQAHQLVLEELHHTLTITHQLIGKNQTLIIQWEQSMEKCK